MGLPRRGAPPNPPQMPSSTSWPYVSARANHESTWYLNQLGARYEWPTECRLRVHVENGRNSSRKKKMNTLYIRRTQTTTVLCVFGEGSLSPASVRPAFHVGNYTLSTQRLYRKHCTAYLFPQFQGYLSSREKRAGLFYYYFVYDI